MEYNGYFKAYIYGLIIKLNFNFKHSINLLIIFLELY